MTENSPRPDLAGLLRQHAQAVRQHIERSIGAEWHGRLTADDVLQTVCIDAIRDFSHFEYRSERSFVQWLKRIADRNIIDAARGLQAEARRIPKADRIRFGHQVDTSVSLVQSLAADGLATPSREITKIDADRVLRSGLDLLPPEHRIVIERYDLQGWTIAAIAREIGRTEGATYMIRTRALQRLREVLSEKVSAFFTNP